MKRDAPALDRVVQHIESFVSDLEIERRGSCAATCPVDLASLCPSY